MNESNAVLAIYASVGRDAAAKERGIEAKVKASMRAVIDGNWMAAGKEEVFRSGIAGALLDVGKDSEDGKRILASVETLRKFNAFLNASQAGLSVSLDGVLPKEDEEQPLPLVAWFHEIAKDSKHADILR